MNKETMERLEKIEARIHDYELNEELQHLERRLTNAIANQPDPPEAEPKTEKVKMWTVGIHSLRRNPIILKDGKYYAGISTNLMAEHLIKHLNAGKTNKKIAEIAFKALDSYVNGDNSVWNLRASLDEINELKQKG